MKKTMLMFAVAAAVMLSASAAVIRVGGSPRADFTQIGDALANAKNGDRIEVEPGVYEPVVVPNALESVEIEAIEWKEKGGAVQDRTVIDAKGNGRCFTARKLETRPQLEMDQVVLRGFQLRNGTVDYAPDAVEDDYVGGGAFGGVLECCQVTDCTAVLGGGAAFSIIRSCQIDNCFAVSVEANDPATGAKVTSGIGGGAYCCHVVGSRVAHCYGQVNVGGVFACSGFRSDNRDQYLYTLYTSIVVDNAAGLVVDDTCNVSDANLAFRGITRLSEDAEVFALDTGYDRGSFKSDSDGWRLSVPHEGYTTSVRYGEFDYLRNPRVTGSAVDIGPVEYVDNDYSILQDDILIGADETEFEVDVMPQELAKGVRLELIPEGTADWVVSVKDDGSSFKCTVLANDTGADREYKLSLKYTVNGVSTISRKVVTVRQLGGRPVSSKGYAVCFGTGKFQLNQGSPWQTEEDGMIKDAVNYAAALEKSRLCAPGDIITLTGDQATCANMAAAFEEIAAVIATNETVYLMISTHGCSGTEDALAYSCCSYECDGFITDSDLCRWFAPITAKGGRVIALFDTCHSSAVYRDAEGPVPTRVRTSYGDSNMFPKDGPVAFITAVDFYQLSVGAPDSSGGLFVQAFIREWMKLLDNCSEGSLPSFMDVCKKTLEGGGGSNGPMEPLTREPQSFNERLLMLTAAAAPGAYPALSEGDDAAPAVLGSVYAGSLNYLDEEMLGYVEFTLLGISKAKLAAGEVRVKAKITDPETGRKRTISGTAEIMEDGSVVFGEVVFRGDRVTGRLDGAVVDGARVLKSRDPGYAGIGHFAGAWNALVTNETDNTKIAISMKVAKSGKVTIKAYDSEGRSYSATSKLLTGDAGWAVIPVVLVKKGASPVTLKYWIRESDDAVRIGSHDLDLVAGGFCRLNTKTVARLASKLSVVADGEQAQEVAFTKPVLKLNGTTGLVTGSLKVGNAAYKLYGVTDKDDGVTGFCFRKGSKTLNFATR